MWSNVQKMIFDIMFMLNLTYFLLNTFLKKIHFSYRQDFIEMQFSRAQTLKF